MQDLQKRNDAIRKWIVDASEKLKEFMTKELIVEEKTNAHDLVTNVDKSIEEFLVGKIHEEFPNEKIISEEGFGDTVSDLDGIVWFVDPIDGTTNFIAEQDHFAIMIAVYEDGVGIMGYVYDVMRDVLYHGIKGHGAFENDVPMEKVKNKKLDEGLFALSTNIMTKVEYEMIRQKADEALGVRMIGSAGLEISDVANGKRVAYMASRLAPWDIAPGKVIAEEVGLVCTDFEGKAFNLLESSQAIFATPHVHRQMMDTIKK